VSIEFIWGVKSWDDLTNQDVELYTMNDIDIIYNTKTKRYSLGIETIYDFEDINKIIQYLEKLLNLFTDFMNTNSYNTKIDFNLSCFNIISFNQPSIEDLYANFYIYVKGICAYLEK